MSENGNMAMHTNYKYRNPILFADYSDPDVIRVGDTYYMTASSFNYTPGLPILISKDLVNWRLVNYAINNLPDKRFNIPRHSEGVWAPSIRFHDGYFYIYYGMPDEGYYVVRTKDPLSKWEEPVCILEGKGLIDPCPFWDEDGRAYVVHGYAKSRIGFKSILGIFEMSPDGMRAISEDHFIFDGNDPTHPAVTIEGPKVYKRDGYYYIWAPAGGVKDGYQVVLRSRDIHGPYHIKTVMRTGNTVINGPHQGGLVDTVNGDEWFIHFQDRGLYGRICHLQPVSWKDGWPIVGVNPDDGNSGEPVYEHDMPNVCSNKDNHASADGIGAEKQEDNTFIQLKYGLEATDYFEHNTCGLQWQWMGNHDNSFISEIPDSDKGIRLYAVNPSGDENPIIWRSANVLTQKLIYPVFSADISMDFAELLNGERAGVCMTGGQYITAYIEREDDILYLKAAKSEGGDKDKKENVIFMTKLDELKEQKATALSDSFSHYKNENYKNSSITFRLTFSLENYHGDSDLYFQNVHYPVSGKNPSLKISVCMGEASEDEFKDIGVEFTPSDHTWVGAKIGIYALHNGNDHESCGYADFNSVIVNEIK